MQVVLEAMSTYFDLLKTTRAEIVNLLKRQGSMSVETLASELEISKVAVRRHLDQLEEQGFIGHCSERCERGRPRFVYSLTNEGDGLFPDTSGDFACDLLSHLGRRRGDDAIDEVLIDQANANIESLRREVEGLDFDSRVRAVVNTFNERGYVAEVDVLADGTYRIVEHNCPIRSVAEHYPQVCREELRVYSEVTGGTVVKTCCMIENDSRSCEYRIVPAPEPPQRALPVVLQDGGPQAEHRIRPAADGDVPETDCGRKRRMAVCVNVHCSMNGADELVEHLVSEYGVAPGVESDTGLSLELTYCFGACDLGPNVEIDGEFYDRVTPDDLDRLLKRPGSRGGA